MNVYITFVQFGIINSKEVAPQDIIDAIDTLRPKNKVEIEILPPGEGPDHFLNWAKAELSEVKSVSIEEKKRKSYNATVYAKCSVECLVDWYLSKYLLNLTIKPYSGAAQKLEALDAETLLGISFSLFNDVVFEPRNRGIHKYELVDEKEAVHSYELANLTIKNCRNTVRPNSAPILYGHIDFARDKDALSKAKKPLDVSGDYTAFYFGGFGIKGNCTIYIDRNAEDGRVCVFTALNDGDCECIFSPIKNRFTSEQLRKVFEKLEAYKPALLDFRKKEVETIIESLSEKKRSFREKQ